MGIPLMPSRDGLERGGKEDGNAYGLYVSCCGGYWYGSLFLVGSLLPSSFFLSFLLLFLQNPRLVGQDVM